MSGSYSNAAARRRRAGGSSIPTSNPQNTGYTAIRNQQYSAPNYPVDQVASIPQGKIHIQQAFDILIQRVNQLEGELHGLGNQENQGNVDFSSHITLLFEKLNTIERRFNTLIKNNEGTLNLENVQDVNEVAHDEFTENHPNDEENERDSLKNEPVTFNFVKKEELNQAVSNVVAKEEFNEIMSSVGKDIGDITERTMQLNELLLQVQNGNIMLNNAISTIRQEMKKRYVVDSKATSTNNDTEVVEDKPSTNLTSMNKNEIANEVKRELSVVAEEVNVSNDEAVDEVSSSDEQEVETNE